MIRLHFEVKTQNGNHLCFKGHDVETEEEMIQLMGTKENYVEYVRERYADEIFDEYGLSNVKVEYSGVEIW